MAWLTRRNARDELRRKIRGDFKWRYFAPDNDQPGNPMRKLAQGDRDAIRTELYRMITQAKAVRTIASVCSVSAAYKMASVSDPGDIYKLTYKTITGRFQYYLQDVGKVSGANEYGLVISDHRGAKDDKSLRAHHQMLLYSEASFTSKYKNLIEGLLLQPSNLSIGIQLAHMTSGAVWRRYERNDDRWYRQLEASLRRGPKHQVEGYGIVKVPKQGWV